MITSETAKSTYITTEGVTEYAVGFGFNYNPDSTPQIKVYKNKDINQPLVYGTDYTISQDGLSVVLASGYEVGDRITIVRDIPFVQLSDYHIGRIDPSQIETDTDESVMRDQQLREEISFLGDVPEDHEERINTLEGEVADIQDVIPEEATDTNQLADKQFVADSISAINLSDLNDTEFDSLAQNDFLKYDGTKWVNSQSTASISFDAIGGSPEDNAALAADLNDKLGSTNITNCALEIPQDIVLTLVEGVLTLKAGSKLYMPAGFELDGVTPKYDEVVVENDMQAVVPDSIRDCAFLTYNIDGRTQGANTYHWSQWNANDVYSGSTAPTASGNKVWYDTTNNVIKEMNDGSTWTTLHTTFPFCVFSSTETLVTSVDEIFNGFGYMSGTAFALPGLKVLIPNGKNANGTLNNTTATLSNVITTIWAGTAVSGNFDVCVNGSQITILRDSTYIPENNYNYWPNGSILSAAKIGKITVTNNINSNFRMTPAFHAIGYNEMTMFMPVGAVIEYAMSNTAPTGFLVCDGSAVSRTRYADLFAVIGTTYGVGDGSTTFNLPNYTSIRNVNTALSIVSNGAVPTYTTTNSSGFTNKKLQLSNQNLTWNAATFAGNRVLNNTGSDVIIGSQTGLKVNYTAIGRNWVIKY